jgi:hypothetical protein
VFISREFDRGAPVIMDYLLQFDLLEETVNCQASISCETPLEIAIEMADAAAVERLIALRADSEQASDYVQPMLWYAMVLLYGSIHLTDPTQEAAYMAGKTRAEIYDPKDCAALDVDLIARRQKQGALSDVLPRNLASFDVLMEHYRRPANPRRKVVLTLRKCCADAN